MYCLKAKDFGTLGRFLSYHLCLACFVNYGYGSAYEKSDSLNVSPPFFFLSFWRNHFFEHAPFFSFPTPLPFPESALLQLCHHKKVMIVRLKSLRDIIIIYYVAYKGTELLIFTYLFYATLQQFQPELT